MNWVVADARFAGPGHTYWLWLGKVSRHNGVRFGWELSRTLDYPAVRARFSLGTFVRSSIIRVLPSQDEAWVLYCALIRGSLMGPGMLSWCGTRMHHLPVAAAALYTADNRCGYLPLISSLRSGKWLWCICEQPKHSSGMFLLPIPALDVVWFWCWCGLHCTLR